MKKILLQMASVALLLMMVPIDAAAWRDSYPRHHRAAEPAKTEPPATAAPPVRRSVDPAPVLSRDPDPLLEDHLWYFQGLAKLRDKDHASAVRFFGDILAAHPDSVWADEARLRLAEALIGQKQYDAALAHVKAFLRNDPNRYEAFEAKLLRARALMGVGNRNAVDHFRVLAGTAPEEARLEEVTAYFDELDRRFHADMKKWFRSPAVQLRIAESFYNASQWDEAARRIKRHVLSKGVAKTRTGRAEYVLAQALARTHHYAEAMSLFNKLHKEGGDYPGLAFWRSRTYAKMDEYDKAIAIRRAMVKRYGRSRTAASYLAKIAFLLLDEGKYKQSIKEWDSVLSMHPRGRKRIEGRWYRAWCAYRLKRYDDAVAGFDWLLNHGASRYGYRDRATYWKARALIESGRKAQGTALLRGLSGTDYYAELARRRLKGDTRTYKTFARASLRGGGGSASPRLPSVEVLRAQSVHLARAAKLVDAGLNDLAAREVRAAEKDGGVTDTMALIELARRSNAHDVARRVAIRRHYGSLKHFSSGGRGRYLWEQAYPEAYPQYVKPRMNGTGIDEKLAWSIMKAESNFRPYVVSPAGAIGLMQLMPSTARRLANGGGYDSSNLFIPEINIDFGTRYIKEKLWPLFPEDHVAVIASYNAGEEAVARWLANKPLREDIELFVEEIPYKETNLYVKRVLQNYWVMQRLYE